MDWHALLWHSGKNIGVVHFYATGDGSGLLYDKFGDFHKIINIDTGTKIIGYFPSVKDAKKWMEEMLKRKVMII